MCFISFTPYVAHMWNRNTAKSRNGIWSLLYMCTWDTGMGSISIIRKCTMQHIANTQDDHQHVWKLAIKTRGILQLKVTIDLNVLWKSTSEVTYFICSVICIWWPPRRSLGKFKSFRRLSYLKTNNKDPVSLLVRKVTKMDQASLRATGIEHRMLLNLLLLIIMMRKNISLRWTLGVENSSPYSSWNQKIRSHKKQNFLVKRIRFS